MSTKDGVPYLDTAKALAIIAVVWGHIASPATDFLFSWHMPFFFLVGGFFIRFDTTFATFARKNALRLGLPYLVFGSLGIAAEIAKRVAMGRHLGAWMDYPIGLLFWMDYTHLVGYHYLLWFLPALLGSRLLVWLIARHLQPTVAAAAAVAFTTVGVMLPVQLPFALNQILLAVLWVWVGREIFNLPGLHFGDRPQAWLTVCLSLVLGYFWWGVPRLNLAVRQLEVPPSNYLFSTAFSLVLLLVCRLWLSGTTIARGLRSWGANSLLIMIAHPYTNNVAYLLARRWLAGAWPGTLLMSLAMLYVILRVKERWADDGDRRDAPPP